MPQVLVVEDDPEVRDALLRFLAGRGYATRSADTGMTGLTEMLRDPPDLVVLDLGLPDVDGTELLGMLRAVSKVPVVVVTARDADEQIVTVLNAGADDYLVKPFSAAQLDARMRAVLRRAGPDGQPMSITVGELIIEPGARRAVLGGTLLDLAPREFELLRYLAEHAGQVVTKRELLSEVWQMAYGGAEKTVDVHLSWLRRKLGETANVPRYLHTVRGVGVRLDPPDESALTGHGED